MAKENCRGYSVMGRHSSSSSCSSSSSFSNPKAVVPRQPHPAHLASACHPCSSLQIMSFLTSEIQMVASHIPCSSSPLPSSLPSFSETVHYSTSAQDSIESGWTTYFDWNASNASSANIEEEEEEESLVSDASSAPPPLQHPEEVNRPPCRKLVCPLISTINYDCTESTRRSSEDIRPTKKRKCSTNPDNEDTATSSCSSDPIKHRLELLQTLIPNGPHELNEEETVQVAFDYIRVLELRLKMLQRLDYYYYNKLR